jgi:hypothetical protein
VTVPEQAGPWPHEQEPAAATRSESPLLARAVAYLPTWGTSLVMHLSLVLVALMATWMVIPETEAVEYQAEVVRRPASKVTRELPREQSRTIHKPQSEVTSSFVFRPTKRPDAGVTRFDGRPVDVIGTLGGPDGAPVGGLPGVGFARGQNPRTIFFPPDPTGPSLDRVVYVIDRSGSMTDSMYIVKNELRRAIDGLYPTEKFHVLFYSTGPAVGLPSTQLLPAIPNNKRHACEFIDQIYPVGETDPSDALRQAFRMKPQLIWLLTDGEFKREIADLIDQLNPRGEVQVNTICFMYSIGEELCPEIARRTGGQYMFVGAADVGLCPRAPRARVPRTQPCRCQRVLIPTRVGTPWRLRRSKVWHPGDGPWHAGAAAPTPARSRRAPRPRAPGRAPSGAW